jgi:hypothetical protein
LNNTSFGFSLAMFQVLSKVDVLGSQANSSSCVEDTPLEMGPPCLLLLKYLFLEPYIDIWTSVKIIHFSIYQIDIYYLLVR